MTYISDILEVYKFYKNLHFYNLLLLFLFIVLFCNMKISSHIKGIEFLLLFYIQLL